MAFVTFTCAGSAFSATLASTAITNGWTRCETGYNWIKPADSVNVCMARIAQLGAIRIYSDISATGYLYTIIEPAVRASYDLVTHTGIGLGWTGQGNPVYWDNRSEDCTARDFTFDGWVDSHCIFGNVKPDSAISGCSTFPIFFCVTKGCDGVNRLVGLDLMPAGVVRMVNARLIYATDALAYFIGLQSGGLGIWGFDSKARLSKLYFFRGGIAGTDVTNPAAILGSFEDPLGIPYALCSRNQGIEVSNDECLLTIGGVDYYYRCMYPTLTPAHLMLLCDKTSNFNSTIAPSSKGIDKIITYWVRRT